MTKIYTQSGARFYPFATAKVEVSTAKEYYTEVYDEEGEFLGQEEYATLLEAYDEAADIPEMYRGLGFHRLEIVDSENPGVVYYTFNHFNGGARFTSRNFANSSTIAKTRLRSKNPTPKLLLALTITLSTRARRQKLKLKTHRRRQPPRLKDCSTRLTAVRSRLIQLKVALKKITAEFNEVKDTAEQSKAKEMEQADSEKDLEVRESVRLRHRRQDFECRNFLRTERRGKEKILHPRRQPLQAGQSQTLISGFSQENLRTARAARLILSTRTKFLYSF